MTPAMYLFLNQQLRMSTGKAGAQVAHAAVEAFRLSGPRLLDAWYQGGHYTKLVMEAQSATQLLVIQRYIEDRGFRTKLIIDEGLTEIEPFQATALGVEIVDKDEPHAAATFGSFRLYKDPKYQPGCYSFDKAAITREDASGVIHVEPNPWWRRLWRR